jgi:glycosyltransferase involved in cell wall biosynthesis
MGREAFDARGFGSRRVERVDLRAAGARERWVRFLAAVSRSPALMKIAIETTPLFTSRAGVARYVRGLLAGLRTVAAPAHEIVELGWPVENLEYAQPQRALKTLAREWGWAKFVAPARARGADIVHHTTLPTIPFFRPARHIVTLHDLALVRHPERFRPWQRSAGLRRLRKVAAADRVICVSQFTADEAMQCLDLPASRIAVVHEGGWLGLGGMAGPPTGSPDATPLPPEFFLFVGSLEPGKNLALLREIYLAVSATGRSLPPLVIAGARWAGVASEGPPPAGWHFLGHVTDAQLGELYRRARALLFPSKYEGFGLPVLEAMTHGCPVVCGRVASLSEIGGDAAYYAELTPLAFGAAMRELLRDEALGPRLRAAGIARAAEFSWERCARETLAVYGSAVRNVAG